MKKIIYTNIISIIAFFILPELYFNTTKLGTRLFSASTLIYFMCIVALLLLYINIKFVIKMHNAEKKVAIFFLIPPALVLLYFILGYFAFSGFTGF